LKGQTSYSRSPMETEGAAGSITPLPVTQEWTGVQGGLLLQKLTASDRDSKGRDLICCTAVLMS
jgi:hypothetical protein